MAGEIEALIQAMARSGEPVNDYARGMTALSLADLSRAQQLGDVAEARRYGELAEERRDVRLTKRQKEANDLQFASAMALKGVTTRDSKGNLLPRSEIEDNNQKFDRQYAENILSNFDNQQKKVGDQITSASEQAFNLIRKETSPEAQRMALKAVLANPAASKALSESDRAKLTAVANSNISPQEAVDKIIKELRDKHSFFTWKSTHLARANAFEQEYLNISTANLNEQKKEELGLYKIQIQKLYQQQNDLDEAKFKHINQWGHLLPKAVVNAVVPPPPADPNKVYEPGNIGGMVGDLRVREQSMVEGDPALQVAKTYVSNASALPAPEVVSRAKGEIAKRLNARPVQTGVYAGIGASPARPGMPVANNPQVISRLNNDLAILNRSQPAPFSPVMGEARVADAATIGTPISTPIPPTSIAEVDAVRKLAQSKYGADTSPQAEAVFQQKLKAGDPSTVQAWNSLLKEVRRGPVAAVPFGQRGTTVMDFSLP